MPSSGLVNTGTPRSPAAATARAIDACARTMTSTSGASPVQGFGHRRIMARHIARLEALEGAIGKPRGDDSGLPFAQGDGADQIGRGVQRRRQCRGNADPCALLHGRHRHSFVDAEQGDRAKGPRRLDRRAERRAGDDNRFGPAVDRLPDVGQAAPHGLGGQFTSCDGPAQQAFVDDVRRRPSGHRVAHKRVERRAPAW